jgi:integrase
MRQATKGVFERNGTWWIDYRDGAGQRHRERIGRHDEAIAAVQERRRQVVEGRFLPPRSRRRAMTFRELAREAMKHRGVPGRLRPRSFGTDEQRLIVLNKAIGKMPAAAVTAATLDQLLDKMLKSGIGGNEPVKTPTANRYRSLLSAIFTCGVRHGRIGANPVASVKRLKESEIRVRYLLPEEEAALRAEIQKKCPEREAEFELALYTGMRRGEQFTLKWAGVDSERGILAVRGKRGPRYVVANKSALAAIAKLRAQRKDSDFVCPETEHENQTDWRRWFERALKAAGIRDFHWHDLRHTFASRLAMAGVDILALQKLMGHKSIVMTMRYSHLTDDRYKAAAEKIGRRDEAPAALTSPSVELVAELQAKA